MLLVSGQVECDAVVSGQVGFSVLECFSLYIRKTVSPPRLPLHLRIGVFRSGPLALSLSLSPSLSFSLSLSRSLSPSLSFSRSLSPSLALSLSFSLSLTTFSLFLVLPVPPPFART